MSSETLNIFYGEPDPDRWVPFDRYPRRLVRRFIRGPGRVGGQRRVFLNLLAGLDKLGVSYRVNDYGYVRSHPDELACVVGKTQVLDRIAGQNPILFGAATFSHPTEHPDFFARYPTVKKILVPGEWMRQMWIEHYPLEKVEVWPVGIDTESWRPLGDGDGQRQFDFLIYDKIMWQHESREPELLQPIRETLKAGGLNAAEIRYGSYHEEQYRHLLQTVRGMIFLCEHETQGIAYQQALASGVPILAWDRGWFWEDPEFYPHTVKYRPVSSVPYWDDRCGVRFRGIEELESSLDLFLEGLRSNRFRPREFILEKLTLEICAQRYVDIWRRMRGEP